MNRTKAFRREKEKQEKNHVKHIIKDVWHEDELINDSKFIGKMAHSPQICSCEMCGNPRHHFKTKTLQELRSDDDLRDIEQ